MLDRINWILLSKLLIAVASAIALLVMGFTDFSPEPWFLAVTGTSLTWLFGSTAVSTGVKLIRNKEE